MQYSCNGVKFTVVSFNGPNFSLDIPYKSTWVPNHDGVALFLKRKISRLSSAGKNASDYICAREILADAESRGLKVPDLVIELRNSSQIAWTAPTGDFSISIKSFQSDEFGVPCLPGKVPTRINMSRRVQQANLDYEIARAKQQGTQVMVFDWELARQRLIKSKHLASQIKQVRAAIGSDAFSLGYYYGTKFHPTSWNLDNLISASEAPMLELNMPTAKSISVPCYRIYDPNDPLCFALSAGWPEEIVAKGF